MHGGPILPGLSYNLHLTIRLVSHADMLPLHAFIIKSHNLLLYYRIYNVA